MIQRNRVLQEVHRNHRKPKIVSAVTAVVFFLQMSAGPGLSYAHESHDQFTDQRGTLTPTVPVNEVAAPQSADSHESLDPTTRFLNSSPLSKPEPGSAPVPPPPPHVEDALMNAFNPLGSMAPDLMPQAPGFGAPAGVPDPGASLPGLADPGLIKIVRNGKPLILENSESLENGLLVKTLLTKDAGTGQEVSYEEEVYKTEKSSQTWAELFGASEDSRLTQRKSYVFGEKGKKDPRFGRQIVSETLEEYWQGILIKSSNQKYQNGKLNRKTVLAYDPQKDFQSFRADIYTADGKLSYTEAGGIERSKLVTQTNPLYARYAMDIKPAKANALPLPALLIAPQELIQSAVTSLYAGKLPSGTNLVVKDDPENGSQAFWAETSGTKHFTFTKNADGTLYVAKTVTRDPKQQSLLEEAEYAAGGRLLRKKTYVRDISDVQARLNSVKEERYEDGQLVKQITESFSSHGYRTSYMEVNMRNGLNEEIFVQNFNPLKQGQTTYSSYLKYRNGRIEKSFQSFYENGGRNRREIILFDAQQATAPKTARFEETFQNGKIVKRATSSYGPMVNWQQAVVSSKTEENAAGLDVLHQEKDVILPDLGLKTSAGAQEPAERVITGFYQGSLPEGSQLGDFSFQGDRAEAVLTLQASPLQGVVQKRLFTLAKKPDGAYGVVGITDRDFQGALLQESKYDEAGRFLDQTTYQNGKPHIVVSHEYQNGELLGKEIYTKDPESGRVLSYAKEQYRNGIKVLTISNAYDANGGTSRETAHYDLNGNLTTQETVQTDAKGVRQFANFVQHEANGRSVLKEFYYRTDGTLGKEVEAVRQDGGIVSRIRKDHSVDGTVTLQSIMYWEKGGKKSSSETKRFDASGKIPLSETLEQYRNGILASTEERTYKDGQVADRKVRQFDEQGNPIPAGEAVAEKAVASTFSITAAAESQNDTTLPAAERSVLIDLTKESGEVLENGKAAGKLSLQRFQQSRGNAEGYFVVDLENSPVLYRGLFSKTKEILFYAEVARFNETASPVQWDALMRHIADAIQGNGRANALDALWLLLGEKNLELRKVYGDLNLEVAARLLKDTPVNSQDLQKALYRILAVDSKNVSEWMNRKLAPLLMDIYRSDRYTNEMSDLAIRSLSRIDLKSSKDLLEQQVKTITGALPALMREKDTSTLIAVLSELISNQGLMQADPSLLKGLAQTVETALEYKEPAGNSYVYAQSYASRLILKLGDFVDLESERGIVKSILSKLQDVILNASSQNDIDKLYVTYFIKGFSEGALNLRYRIDKGDPRLQVIFDEWQKWMENPQVVSKLKVLFSGANWMNNPLPNLYAVGLLANTDEDVNKLIQVLGLGPDQAEIFKMYHILALETDRKFSSSDYAYIKKILAVYPKSLVEDTGLITSLNDPRYGGLADTLSANYMITRINGTWALTHELWHAFSDTIEQEDLLVEKRWIRKQLFELGSAEDRPSAYANTNYLENSAEFGAELKNFDFSFNRWIEKAKGGKFIGLRTELSLLEILAHHSEAGTIKVSTQGTYLEPKSLPIKLDAQHNITLLELPEKGMRYHFTYTSDSLHLMTMTIENIQTSAKQVFQNQQGMDHQKTLLPVSVAQGLPRSEVKIQTFQSADAAKAAAERKALEEKLAAEKAAAEKAAAEKAAAEAEARRLEAAKKAAAEKAMAEQGAAELLAEKKAEEKNALAEKKVLEQKAKEAKSAADKALTEKKAAEKSALEATKALAKATAERAAAEKKAVAAEKAAEKAAAAAVKAAEKAAAAKKPADKRAAEKKAVEAQKAAEKAAAAAVKAATQVEVAAKKEESKALAAQAAAEKVPDAVSKAEEKAVEAAEAKAQAAEAAKNAAQATVERKAAEKRVTETKKAAKK